MSPQPQTDRSVQPTKAQDWTRSPAAIAATLVLAIVSVCGIVWSVNRTLQQDQAIAIAPNDRNGPNDPFGTIGAADGDSARDDSTHELSTVRLIDLNTASAGELEMLPSIGPATATKIIADRDQNGKYDTIDDLQRVSGIGPKTIEKIRPLVRVSQ